MPLSSRSERSRPNIRCRVRRIRQRSSRTYARTCSSIGITSSRTGERGLGGQCGWTRSGLATAPPRRRSARRGASRTDRGEADSWSDGLLLGGNSLSRQRVDLSRQRRDARAALAERRYRTEPDSAWVYLAHPAVVRVLERHSWRGVVFDLCDDISEIRGVHPSVHAAERELLRKADALVASSRSLVEKRSRSVARATFTTYRTESTLRRFADVHPWAGTVTTACYIVSVFEWPTSSS